MTGTAALDALDLLLALRPDDLEPDEVTAASAVPAAERAAIEGDDAALASLIGAWADELPAEPSFTGADILARAANEPLAGSLVSPLTNPTPRRAGSPMSRELAERPTAADAGHAASTTGGGIPSWLVPVALAASLAAAAFGGYQLLSSPVDSPESRPKALVGEHEASRVALQFSVETGTQALPGRNGGTYGPESALAFRFDLAGEAGHVALLEVGADGSWEVVYPLDGQTLALDPGVHPLADGRGAPLVYRPDDAAAGTLDYVAVVLSEPVDPGRVMPGLLAAGLHRADLWPRPVVAVDAVTVTWEAR